MKTKRTRDVDSHGTDKALSDEEILEFDSSPEMVAALAMFRESPTDKKSPKR